MSILETAMQTVIGLMPDKAPDPLIESRREIGKSLSRIDGPLKVMGRARFAAEVPLDGLAYAALVHSSIACGRIETIGVTEAERAPGVLLVMTYKNAPRMPAPGLMMADPKGAAGSDLPVMQDASIHWNGEPVALVIADTQEQADHASTLIEITYREATAATSFDRLKDKARSPGKVLREPAKVAIGDAEAALWKSKYSVDRIYKTPRHNHAAIELHAATVVWSGDTLIVHDASQMVNLTRSCLAGVFQIPEDNVRVLSPFVGGGFGNKGLWSHQILAAAAARLLKRPVRIVLSRESVFRMTGGRTLTEQRVALGAEDEGSLSALIHTGIAGMTSHNNCPEQFTFPARHLYAAESLLVDQTVIDLNMVANTFMRAPGESVGTFALESAIDELAEAMGMDPIALRQRIEPEKDQPPVLRSPRAILWRLIGKGRNALAGRGAIPFHDPIATGSG
jgi:xanthine dehydrogenase YagR molybdenum-binding subunit